MAERHKQQLKFRKQYSEPQKLSEPKNNRRLKNSRSLKYFAKHEKAFFYCLVRFRPLSMRKTCVLRIVRNTCLLSISDFSGAYKREYAQIVGGKLGVKVRYKFECRQPMRLVGTVNGDVVRACYVWVCEYCIIFPRTARVPCGLSKADGEYRISTALSSGNCRGYLVICLQRRARRRAYRRRPRLACLQIPKECAA